MQLWFTILIGIAILQEYILLEHVKEITQWPFFENSVQKEYVSKAMVQLYYQFRFKKVLKWNIMLS